MIKLIYANGKHKGEIYRIWKDYAGFAKDTLDLVARTAFDNKLSQKALFLHYGYGVSTNEKGQTGYTNGILGGMNFWIDSFPDLIFEYDSVVDSDEDLKKETGKRDIFYSWLNRMANIPGLQLFRTSNELWSVYASNESTEEIPVWEPNVPVPQQILEEYPTVASILEAGNLINSDQQQENIAGLWAVEHILLGESIKRIVPEMRAISKNADKAAEFKGSVHAELGVVFFAFLTAKFYEEIEAYL